MSSWRILSGSETVNISNDLNSYLYAPKEDPFLRSHIDIEYTKEWLTAFRDFVEKIEAQVTVEDILEGRRQDIVKGFGINDANAMIDKLAKNNIIHDNKAANLKANFAKHVSSLKK